MLLTCSGPAYGEYVWKVIPSIEISDGYETLDGKIVSRTLIRSLYVDDYFTSRKPALSLFLNPSDTLYINAGYSIKKHFYSKYTSYNTRENSANLFMNYALPYNLSIGVSASHEEFQVRKFGYMDYKSTATKPFAGIKINEFDLTFSQLTFKKEYEERLFETIDPIEEDYYKNELMLSYSFSPSKSISLGVDYGQNESNFSVFDYHYEALFLSGRFNIYKKVKATLFYRREKTEYDRLPWPIEVVFLYGLNPDFALANKDSLLSTREDREDIFSLQVYSIINSWLKLSLDYSYTSNHSSYSWEEYENQIVSFSIKFFQRYKK